MPLTKLTALLSVLVLAASCTQTAAPTPTTAPTATVVRATAAPTPTRAPGAAPVATPTPAPAPTQVAAGPKYGGVLRGYVPFDMREWDIQREPGAAWPMHYAGNAVFGRLYAFEQAGDKSCDNPVVPVIAESYKYLDGQTLEVTLRPGVKFHSKPPVNGREFTAQDVVWNFTRLKQVARSGQVTPSLRLLDRVQATGPFSVRFYFTEPFAFAVPSLLATMTGPLMYAPEAGGPEQDYRDPYKSWIGTGPFLFKEWRPGVKMTFTRNPNYFKAGKPYVDGLEILVMEDDSTRLAALLAGKVDLLWRVSPSTVQFLRSSRPGISISGCPYYAGFGTVWMRTDKAPFNDVRVRRALSMAIDRQAIIDTLFLGEGEVLSTVPSQYGEYSLSPKDLPAEVRRYTEYRPDEAKKLLADAGFPNGFTTTLETSTQFGSPFNESQEAMIAMWAKIGVKVEPKWLERGRYTEVVNQGSQDALAWGRTLGIGTPWELSSQRSTSETGANRSHVNDPELDKVIDRYTSSFDAKQQATLAREIQKRLVDQAYVIQQPTPLEYAVMYPYVKDFGRMSHMSRVLTLYERIWLDK